jgi:hypothetical protein
MEESILGYGHLFKKNYDAIKTPVTNLLKLVQNPMEQAKEEKKGGLRYNQGKLRFDLEHPIAREGLVKVLTKGAEKYAERNWEKGMKWSTVIASLKRHLNALEKCEDYDSETGLLHADHIQCNAHFLSAYYKIAPQFDDRPHTYLRHPKIGLDIDEVLCDWVNPWCKYHGQETPKSWFFDRDIMKKFKAMEEDGTLEDFYLNLPVLTKPEDIPFEPHCYVTSRPCSVETTEKWLDKNGFPARPVYTVGLGESKVEVIKKSGLEVFVDDRFDNFEQLNNAGICTFLFDSNHNQRYNVGYKRIKSLKELL